MFRNGVGLQCKDKIISIKNGLSISDSDKFKNSDTLVNIDTCKEF